MIDTAAGGTAAGGISRPVRDRPGGPVRPSRPVPPRRVPSRLTVLVVAGALMLAGETAAWVGRAGAAVAPTAPVLSWSFSPASNTVTLRLTAAGGAAGRGYLARSVLRVAETGRRPLTRHARGRAAVRIPVPPGRRTRLLAQVTGPQPYSRAFTVTAPRALRLLAARPGGGGVLLSMSGALRPRAGVRLCGNAPVSFRGADEVAVASTPDGCRARLTLTARDGEQAVVGVTVPSLPKIPLYSFASPAGRAVYVTVDDGWTPSKRVLALMRRTHLPVTAFLIEQAARENLPYWRAFMRAGGTIGDHTVSHPDLTTETLGQATAQWRNARQALGGWLGPAPVMGRPPYGAFNSAVRAAAYRSGLRVLVGWSVVVDRGRIQTWDGRGLEAGEIVLLHWVPGLDGELTSLLAAIHARHLHPVPLTPASFAGVTPQTRSLNGD